MRVLTVPFCEDDVMGKYTRPERTFLSCGDRDDVRREK